MSARPLNELIDPGWAQALEPVAAQVSAMGEFLRAENAAGHGYLPAGENVLRAFTFPLDEVRVLIVGQDHLHREVVLTLAGREHEQAGEQAEPARRETGRGQPPRDAGQRQVEVEAPEHLAGRRAERRRGEQSRAEKLVLNVGIVCLKLGSMAEQIDRKSVV